MQIANVGMPDRVKRRDLCPKWTGILGIWMEKEVVDDDAHTVEQGGQHNGAWREDYEGNHTLSLCRYIVYSNKYLSL